MSRNAAWLYQNPSNMSQHSTLYIFQDRDPGDEAESTGSE